MSTLPKKAPRRYVGSSAPAPRKTTRESWEAWHAHNRPERLARRAAEIIVGTPAYRDLYATTIRVNGRLIVEVDAHKTDTRAYFFLAPYSAAGPGVAVYRTDRLGQRGDLVAEIVGNWPEAIAEAIANRMDAIGRTELADGIPDHAVATDTMGGDIFASDFLASVEPRSDGSDADHAATAAAESRCKHSATPRRIRNARDLLLSIGDHLASLGLESDVRGDEMTFEFLGHVHRLDLEDLERHTPGRVSAAEAAMFAAGLPVG